VSYLFSVVLVKSQSGGVGEDAPLAVAIDYDGDKKKHDYDIILKRIMMTMRKRSMFFYYLRLSLLKLFLLTPSDTYNRL
jgi:hypothetical protein